MIGYEHHSQSGLKAVIKHWTLFSEGFQGKRSELICSKLVSFIFYWIFISHQMIALQKLWKMFFISYKCSFRSQDSKIFVFLSSPYFSTVSHCFRGWLKINLNAFDVINCLNKNLITHFVWYYEKEKRYSSETLSVNRVLNKEHFYSENLHKKLVLDPFKFW